MSITTFSISSNYIDSKIKQHDFTKKPLIIGISGPQGSGKSYLTNQLSNYLLQKYPHFNTVSFSMDDVYLTRHDQKELTNSTDNPLLQGRGLPGTHDLSLVYDIFNRVIQNYKNFLPGEEIQIPKYDKSKYNGLGDRSDSSTQIVTSPIDILIFEGWFNGYINITDDLFRLKYLTSEVSGVLQLYKMYHLEEINTNLAHYQNLWKYFDLFITIKASDVNDVYVWRTQQEHDLINKTGTGMTDEQVHEFVNRYMPVYILYYQELCDHGLKNCENNLIIPIDINRNVIQ